MYNKFFGFKEKPFKLVPNPEYLFLSKSHEEALAHLAYAISQGDGFVEITGEVGTGKTTLCRVFLENLDKSIEAAYIFNPKLDALQLLKSINDELGIDSAPDNTKDLIDRLNAFLIEKKAAGQKVLVLIDEAQNLSLEVLEQLRLLSNLETTREKLLQIILVGQPELGDMLASHQLRQLGQRITINCRILPLTYDETRDYIRHRIALASHRAGPPFDKASYRAIYDYSGGIPRLINIACDRSLLNAFSRNSFKITRAITKEAILELTRKKAGGSYNWLQGPASLGIALAVIIPLVLLILYLANGESPGPPGVSKTFPPGHSPPVADQAVVEERPPAPEPTFPADNPDSLQAREPIIRQEESPGPVLPEYAATTESLEASEIIALTADNSKVPAEPLAGHENKNIKISSGSTALHSVHVGSFQSGSQASARLAEIKALGYPSFMYTQKGSSGDRLFVVVAGTYQSYDLAKQAGRSLSRAGYRNFISRAKDSLAAGPVIAEQQPNTTDVRQQPQATGDSQNFLNFLKKLNSRYSRNNAMEEILKLWLPAAEVQLDHKSINTDRLFFQEAAKQNSMEVQPVATETDLALIQSLNLPAVFTFYLTGHSWPKYLTVTSIDKEKIYFADAMHGSLTSVKKDIFLQYWSGEAYIFWKDFNGLKDMITLGTKGQEVKTLKILLQQIGYDNIVLTDTYDKNTMQVIRDIQIKYGLLVDGLVGPLTKIALYNESSEFAKPSLVKFAAATMENGS